MKKNPSEVVFILDKSGSMAGLESDTIGGYNAMLQKQKDGEDEVAVTTVLFNDRIDILHDRIDVKELAPITAVDYEVGGTTALLDAIGTTIHKVSHAQKRICEEEPIGKVLFVITTDGMENASREYNYSKVKAMIEHQKETSGWEFIFLGANIDAVETAGRFGIHEKFAVNYHADSKGTKENYEVLSEVVTSFRKGEKLASTWKDTIEKDFDDRS